MPVFPRGLLLVTLVLPLLAALLFRNAGHFGFSKGNLDKLTMQCSRRLATLSTIGLYFHDVTTQPTVTNVGTGVTYLGAVANGVEHFGNISFGQDTSGRTRLAPPLPFTYPPGSRVLANVTGAACPQPIVPVAGFEFLFSNVTDQSEDCLNLRIARPAGLKPESKLPVMIWLYGGGHFEGQIYDKFYTPGGLIKQSAIANHTVIYVALNYRVNMLGFASSTALRASRSENAGLRDQRLGIKWVKANIAAFGGDVNSITLFGQSAGATDISLQYLAYGGARGASFTGAIMESGTATSQWGMLGNSSAGHTAAVTVKVGCAENEEAAGSAMALACLRALPLKTLQDVEIAYGQATVPPWGFTVFAPVVDGDFFPTSPSALYRSGRFSREIPMIAGWNRDDASILIPTALNSSYALKALFTAALPSLSSQNVTNLLSLYPSQQFEASDEADKKVSPQFYRASRIFRDLAFTCPALAFGAALLTHNATSNIRFYEFNQTIFTQVFYAPRNEAHLGISHFSEIPYIFDELRQYGITDEGQLGAAAAVSRMWSSFAAMGNPGVTSKGWPIAYLDGKAPAGISGGNDEARVLVSLISVMGPETKTLQLGGGDMQIERCAFINQLTTQQLV